MSHVRECPHCGETYDLCEHGTDPRICDQCEIERLRLACRIAADQLEASYMALPRDQFPGPPETIIDRLRKAAAGAAMERCERYEEALTTIRDTLPERQDAYARLVFATAANALEPEPST